MTIGDKVKIRLSMMFGEIINYDDETKRYLVSCHKHTMKMWVSEENLETI